MTRFTHDAMACTFELYLPGAEPRYAGQAAQAAFDELDRLEQLLSRFIPHSDIARLNALAPGQSLCVSPETLECLQLAAQIYTATGGAFDIAYRRRPQLRGTPLACDPQACTVGALAGPIDLDLGALGKGYAVERLVGVLREWRIASALVHSGQSTVYAHGLSPTGAPWRLALRSPDDTAATIGSIQLGDAALSGSGQRLHGGHIIDPATGRPAARCEATWAIAPSAALSDALSTAFMLLPPEQVERTCAQWPGVSAILLPRGARPPEALCFGPLARSVEWIPLPGELA
jgi:thiamine biosynthesis lipoprotein